MGSSPSRRSRTLLRLSGALLTLALLASGGLTTRAASGPTRVYFPQTGHTLGGDFLDYWHGRGRLAIFGYPITEETRENGRTVQYFERAVFEEHPDAPQGWTVQLRRLATDQTAGRQNETPFRPISAETDAHCTFYAVTGHRLCNGFRTFWQDNGGLAIFGYPISEEFTEHRLTVQYFERARFEWHPDLRSTPYEVELGLLGNAAATADGVDRAPVPRSVDVPVYDPGLWPPQSVQLPIAFHAQQDPNWCDPADLQMWLQYAGASLLPGDDHAVQAALWNIEITNNDGYTLDQWSASPYAVATAFNHVFGRAMVGDAAFDSVDQAGAVITHSIAVDRQPVIALVDSGTHYILISGVVVSPGGSDALPASVTVYDPWTISSTRGGYPAMGQGTVWDWQSFTARFTPDALTDPGIWSGKWVVIAAGLPLGS